MSQCIFCGKEAEDWNTNIQLVHRASGLLLAEVSVCPSCRENHTIDELYTEIINRKAKKLTHAKRAP